MINSGDSILVSIRNIQKNDSELFMEVLKEKSYDDYILHNNVLYKYKEGQELLVIHAKKRSDTDG